MSRWRLARNVADYFCCSQLFNRTVPTFRLYTLCYFEPSTFDLPGAREARKLFNTLPDNFQSLFKFIFGDNQGRSDTNDTGTAGFELNTITNKSCQMTSLRVNTYQKALLFHPLTQFYTQASIGLGLVDDEGV